MTKYYASQTGIYLGGFDGANPPAGAIEIASPPIDGRMIWDGTKWIDNPIFKQEITEEKRDSSLISQGITTEEKLESLWDRVVNGNLNSTDAIQAAIEKSKTDFPDV